MVTGLCTVILKYTENKIPKLFFITYIYFALIEPIHVDFLAKQVLLKINRIARIWHFKKRVCCQLQNVRPLYKLINEPDVLELVTGSTEVCVPAYRCMCVFYSTPT